MPKILRHFNVLAAISVAVVGCATSSKQLVIPDDTAPKADAVPDTKALPQTNVPGSPGPDEDVISFDVNGDGKPDMFKFYPKGKSPTDPARPATGAPAIRKEVDLNGDGKIDMWVWYGTDGDRTREALDLDFDGKVDEVVFYEKGTRVRVEGYTAGHDKPDTFKYYERNKLVRVERDRNNDGKIDYWEYWENDAIDRIGEDNDYDGNVDQWHKAQAQAKK